MRGKRGGAAAVPSGGCSEAPRNAGSGVSREGKNRFPRRRAPKRAKIVVFCDNARYYRSSVVREYLEKSRVELRFLPPYSPNLNPIERLWRFMKKTVCYNRYHATLGGFRGALLEFFAGLTGKYRDQLKTLITTNFHVIDPAKVRVIGDA